MSNMLNFFGGVSNGIIRGIAGNSDVANLGVKKLQVMTDMQRDGFEVNPVKFMNYLLGVNHKCRYDKNMIYFYSVAKGLADIKTMPAEEKILEKMQASGKTIDDMYDPNMMKLFLSKVYEYLVSRSMSNVRSLVIRDCGGDSDVVRAAREDLDGFIKKKYKAANIKMALVNIFNKERILKYGFFKRMDIYQVGGSEYRNTIGNYYLSAEIDDYILVTQKQEVGFKDKFIGRAKSKAPIPTIMNVIPKSGFNKHNIESLRTVLYLITNYDKAEKKYGSSFIDELIRAELSILIPHDETIIRLPQSQQSA